MAQRNTKTPNGYKRVSDEVNRVAKLIVHAAYTAHSNLGPGLLERIYDRCFCHELQKQGLNFRREVVIPILYEGMKFPQALRLDVLVEDVIICELKAVPFIKPIHVSQLIAQLRLSGKRLGFLINFNVARINEGIRRIIL